MLTSNKAAAYQPHMTSKKSDKIDYFKVDFGLNQRWKHTILFRDECLTSRHSIHLFANSLEASFSSSGVKGL